MPIYQLDNDTEYNFEWKMIRLLFLMLICFNADATVRSFDSIVRSLDQNNAVVCTHTGVDTASTYDVSVVRSDGINVGVVTLKNIDNHEETVFGLDLSFVQKLNEYINRTNSINEYGFNSNLKINVGFITEYGYSLKIRTEYTNTIVEIGSDGKTIKIVISDFADFDKCFRFTEYVMKNT